VFLENAYLKYTTQTGMRLGCALCTSCRIPNWK